MTHVSLHLPTVGRHICPSTYQRDRPMRTTQVPAGLLRRVPYFTVRALTFVKYNLPYRQNMFMYQNELSDRQTEGRTNRQTNKATKKEVNHVTFLNVYIDNEIHSESNITFRMSFTFCDPRDRETYNHLET